jgi:uncharacterized protein YhdP
MKRLISGIHQLLLLPMLLLLVVVVMLRIGLQSHPLYHGQVESWLQQAIGQEVDVEDFNLQLQGRNLAIDVQGVSVGDDGLAWQRLAFKLDVLHLLEFQQLKLSQVRLFGLDVTIQESTDGEWQPVGLPSLKTSDDSVSDATPVVLLGILNQAGSLALNDGRLTLIPRLGPALSLHNLNGLIMPAGERAVAVQWQASYPNTLGSLSAIGQVQLADDFTIDTAKAHIQFDSLPLEPLWQQLDYQHLQAGELSADAWVQVTAQSTHMQLRNIHLATDYDSLPLSVKADVDIASTTNSRQIVVQNLSGGMGNHAWPLADLQIDAIGEEWLVTSEQVDAAPITPLLTQFANLPIKVTEPIIGLAPTGLLKQPSFYWHQQQPKAFLFTATMENASVSAWKGVPNVDKASGLIAITATGGKVSIDDSDGLRVHMPKLTTSPWVFDTMAGDIGWRFDQQFSYLQSSLVELTQDAGRLHLHLGGQFPRRNVIADSMFQMRLGLEQIIVEALPDMLPDLTMGSALSDYLRSAASDGVIESGGVTFNGLLGPAAKQLGAYAYSVPVWGHAELPRVQYSPGWPQMAGVNLDFASDHQQVSITINEAHFVQYPRLVTNNWLVKVPMLNTVADAAKATIDVTGQLAEDAQLLLQVAATLPDEVVVPEWISDLNPQGHTQLQLQTSVPYGKQAKGGKPSYDIKVKGQGLVANWQAKDIHLSALDLSAHVTSQGLQNLSAVGFADEHQVQLSRLSKVQPENLTYPLGESALKAVLQPAQDQAWLRLQGQFPADYAMLKLGLATLQIDDWLPEKAKVDAYLPECFLLSDQCQQVMGDLIFQERPEAWPSMAHHTGAVTFAWHKQQQTQELALANGRENLYLNFVAGQWQGLGIGLDALAPRLPVGTHVNGNMEHVDAAYWFDLAQTEENGLKSAISFPAVTSVSIQSDTLQWQDLWLNSALLSYELVDQGWAFGLLSDEFAGHVFNAGDDSPWLVDIDHIRVTLPEEDELEEDTEPRDLLANVDPAILPSMDVEIHEITKNDRSMGSWSAKLRNDNGTVFVHDLVAQIHGSKLAGNMIWSKAAGQHKTAFSGRVVTNQVADTLQGFGYSPSIDSDYGSVEVQLTWPKSPLAFDIEYSTGDLALRVKQGEISKTPDVANSLKVLSLLDMNRLMQRIRLDFTDVLNDEYVFNSIYAHYQFKDGVGRTVTPAEFIAPSLELSLEGSINFPSRLLYHDLYVTIPVVDKLPLAALLAGIPQLSGALYIVDKLIGNELATFTSVRYTVAGDLDDPDVEMQQVFDKNVQSQTLDERINNVFKFQ